MNQKYFWTFSLIFFAVAAYGLRQAQTTEHPHGEDFNITCSECHSPNGWFLDTLHYSYDHDEVYELLGSHKDLDCKQCHQTLEFKLVDNQCSQCHNDMHENTLGNSCDRCHSNSNWLVTNIMEIHQNSRFDLQGAHAYADCQQCHENSNPLVFQPLSIDCYSCHQAEYIQTNDPNHELVGFGTDCAECHTVFSIQWDGNFNHHFFPLIKGHNLPDCNSCHAPNTYFDLDPTCFSCHESDYLSTSDPNHQQTGFSTDCDACHDLTVDWAGSKFDHDSQYFPIYSGHHEGEWNSCYDCHTSGSYESFHCLDCHEHNQEDMDRRHNGTLFYKYDSNRCIICHPNG